MKNLTKLVALAAIVGTLTIPQSAQAVANGLVSPAEIAGYQQIYGIDIPNNANFLNSVPYTIDNSGAVIPGGIARIAYFYQLDNTWVWTSMDAFEQNLLNIGFPTLNSNNFFHDQLVTNLNVEASGGSGITTGTGISTGNVEIWATNYGQTNVNGIPLAANNNYDWGDERVTGGSFGSFQVHNHGEPQVIFAINQFNGGGTFNTGIGNAPTGNLDYTFQNNSTNFNTRQFEVWVLPVAAAVPEPTTATLGLLGLAGLMVRRRRAA